MMFLLIIASIFCEYRTYLLDIQISNEKHIVLKSTLDHKQFVTWHSGINKVELLDSWMCFGDTSSYKKTCDKYELNESETNDK